MAKKTKQDRSQDYAKLTVQTPALAAEAMRGISGFEDNLNLQDLVGELKKLGDDIAGGDLGRIERMLATQAVMLDTMFNNLMCRAHRCETLSGMATHMKLALKAQAQTRATAETLSIMKNPAPVIRQANIAAGPQQVNNTYAAMQDGDDVRAGEKQKRPNRLLVEVSDGERMEFGEAAAASRGDQDMATMDTLNRAGD